MDTTPVILAAKRTPVGRFLGGYSGVSAVELGAQAVRAALDAAPGAADEAEECVIGCVLQAGLGQNPARQIGLAAGLPDTLSACTVNKVCGSGLEAVMQAARAVRCGDARCVVAGGAENMTRAPHLALLRPGVRGDAPKFGPAALRDHMQADGLTCALEHWAMGDAAEHIARVYAVSREAQDRCAAQSHRRAAAAQAAGAFDAELAPLEGGPEADEGVRPDTTEAALAALRPAFSPEGTVTAGNASQISDGAAALVVAAAGLAERLGLTPLARVVAQHTSGVAPKDIFAAPISGVRGVLDKAGLALDDIDLFEINEAFAAQVIADTAPPGPGADLGTDPERAGLGIPEDKLNVCGGAIALGHPIGASGARVLTTLVHQLRRVGGRYGLASLCLGGGNSVSMVVESLA